MAKAAPEQSKAKDNSNFTFKGYDITPLANFSLTAKVLSRKDYHFGRDSDLAPVDLALGWGNMSDESVLQYITIRQSNRWYRWNTQQFPIPRREIETSSANMHMIPANKDVEKTLKKVRHGEIIQLTGELVKVTNKEGFLWTSSLTREDTGGGSCELIWVEKLNIVTDN